MARTDALTGAVAEEIRAWMGRRRITGAQLAKTLGVSAAWVSYRINGSVSPSVQDLARIAGVLGVPVAALLPAGEIGRTDVTRQQQTVNVKRPKTRPSDNRPPRRSTGPNPKRPTFLRPVSA